MKEINVAEITKAVEKMCIDSNYCIPDDVKYEIKKCTSKC